MPRSSNRKTVRPAAAVFAASLGAILCAVDTVAAPLDPNSFGSLGTLDVGSGSITIDTDALSISGAATFNGTALSQLGGPQVAVFDFDRFNIGAGVTINVIGSRPLALLSLGSMTIASGISLNGGNGAGAVGGAAGAAGGFAGGAGGMSGGPGGGPGGGGAALFSEGAGGAYGGAGVTAFGGAPGGVPYGNLLNTLQGGSGGGGQISIENNTGGGGGGAGAIELGAVGTLSLTSVLANGGVGAGYAHPGGSGAGGGILLHAGAYSLGTIQALGGAAAGTGGAGGGGRIAVIGGTLTAEQVSALLPSVDGGASFGGAGVLTLQPALAIAQFALSLNIGLSPQFDPRLEFLPENLNVTTGGTANLVSPIVWGEGSVVDVSGGALNVASSSTFSTGSTLRWSGGSVVIASQKLLAFDGGVGTVTAGGRGLSDGATLRITGGGEFSSSSYFDIGSSADPGNGPNGALVVDGAGSRFSSDSAFWGYNAGDFATITLMHQGAATINVVQLATNGGKALVNLTSGATLNISSLSSGNTNSGGTATININGGALSLFGTGVSASLREGSTVNLLNGVFNLQGDATFSRSNFNWTGGTLIIASGKTLTFSGATASLSGISGVLSGGATLRLLNGSRLNGSGFFDVGNSSGAGNGSTGTLLIDGADTLMSLAGTSYWAYEVGNAATVTISNQAVGSFSGLTLAGKGGHALVNLLSGGTLSVETPLIGSAVGTSAATININGGALKIGLGATFRQGTVVNFSSGTFIDAGTLILSDNAKILLTPGGDKVVRSGVVSMSGTSKIDLADNDMIVDYTVPSQLPTIKGYLIAGRNGGNWTGNSLTSSSAALDPNHSSLGYGEASDVLGAGGGTFDGVSVDGTAVLVKFTYLGDANLDGVVDLKDLYRLAINYNAGGKLWTSGDFNYDGLTNVQDLTALAINWQAGVGAPLGMSITQALARLGLPQITVPEPGMLCAIIGPYILWRRRKAGRRQSRP
jgi:hypothetical protein